MRWRTSISPIGVSMDGSYLQAAQLARHGGQWFISAAARVGQPSAPGDSPGLPIAELKDLLSRRGFSGRRLVVGLPPEALLTGVLDVPARGSGAPVDAIAQAELARMHQCDPKSLEIANWGLPQAGRKDTAQVMAVACPHQTAETVLGPFEEAGFDVMALDSQLHGLLRAAERELAADGITAILQLGWVAATLVMGLLMEAMRKIVSAAIGFPASASAMPPPCTYATLPRRASSATAPDTLRSFTCSSMAAVMRSSPSCERPTSAGAAVGSPWAAADHASQIQPRAA